MALTPRDDPNQIVREILQDRALIDPATRQTITSTAPNPLPRASAAPMGGTVNLPGWDASRTDNDPKYVFGRYAQSKGGHLTAQDVRDFVNNDLGMQFGQPTANAWELGGNENDPQIRVKQDVLNTWKPGTSMWQDVIRDAGGANAAQFENAGGPQAQLGGVPIQSGLPANYQPSSRQMATADYGPMTGGLTDIASRTAALVQQLMGGDNNAFLRMLLRGE